MKFALSNSKAVFKEKFCENLFKESFILII